MISKRKRTIKYAIANQPLAVKRGSERERERVKKLLSFIWEYC